MIPTLNGQLIRSQAAALRRTDGLSLVKGSKPADILEPEDSMES